MKYSGADWIESNLKCKCSALGTSVANLLGDVFKGIYHLSNGSLQKTNWENGYCIEYTLCGELSTVDFNLLTILVVLAHDRMIRVTIQGVGPGYMRLMFHQRTKRTGSMFERYPTIEDHIKQIREHYN